MADNAQESLDMPLAGQSFSRETIAHLDVPDKKKRHSVSPTMPSRSPSIVRHRGLAQRDARSEYARYAKLDYLGNLDLDDITSPLEKPREMHIDTHCICETYQEKDVRLVLHFDVNKTIIMQDQAANKSVEDTVNDVLCDSTWGIIDVEPLVPTWTACLKHPSIKPPVIEGELIGSYKTFVDRYYLPYTPLRAGETKEEMIARHTKVRTKRRGMVSTFTSKGHPGECFRKFYRRLLDRLKIEQVVPLKKSEQFDEPLRTFVHKETVVDNVEEDGNYDNAQPDSVADTLKGQRGSSAAIDENQVDKPFDTKYHFLIPSFFELILHLTKVDRQFYLIFRTFGTELMNVLKALQDFCEGNHKDYPFVPKSLTAKLIPPHMHDNHQIAAMYRDGLDPEGTHLIVGTTFQPPGPDGLAVYRAQKPDVEVVSGFNNIYHRISGMLSNTRVIGIRDHYAWWGMNEGRDNAGKLFLIQQFGKYGHQDGRGSDAGSPFGPRTPSRRSHDAMSPSTQPSRKSTEPNLSLPAPKPMRATHSFSSLSNDRSERLHIDPDIRVPAHPDRRHSPLIQPNQLNATNSTTTPNPTPKNLDTASSAAKLTDTASATSFIVTQEDSTEFVHNTSTDQSMPPLESLAVDADVSPRPSGSSTPIWKRRGAPIIRHEVFFDDNASVVPHPNKRNIVDVRWLEGDHPGEQVEMDLFAHRYVVRVSPLMAILDPHYFINEVHEVCRRTRHADKDRGVVRTRRSTLSGPLPSTLVETLEQYVQQAGDKEGRDLVISRTEDSLEVARDEVDSTSHASSSS